MSTIGQEIGHAGAAPGAAAEQRPSAERKVDKTLPRHLQRILMQDLEEPARRYLPADLRLRLQGTETMRHCVATVRRSTVTFVPKVLVDVSARSTKGDSVWPHLQRAVRFLPDGRHPSGVYQAMSFWHAWPKSSMCP
jgi:hypothetical protein